MRNPRKTIIVKDDGHIDLNIWFGRYGIKYKSKKISNPTQETNQTKFEQNQSLLKIRTSDEGLRRWSLGIQQCKKQGTKGWHTLELRLHVMKHGTIDGFHFNNFKDYQKTVAYYS
jgi:hypothetical protein